MVHFENQTPDQQGDNYFAENGMMAKRRSEVNIGNNIPIGDNQTYR